MATKKSNTLSFKDRPILFVGPMAGEENPGRLSRISPDKVIFVDGGLDFESFIFQVLSGATESVSIGDGDSTVREPAVKLPINKDRSDLSHALELCPENTRQLEFFGFLGGRKDHELGNLGEVAHFLGRRQNPSVAHFGAGIWALAPGRWKLTLTAGFSLMALTEAWLSLSGKCLYTCEKKTIRPLSSLGLSNQGDGEILIDCSSPFFIFSEETKPIDARPVT